LLSFRGALARRGNLATEPATNIVKPVISVITDISKDHTKELGDTLEKISFEKAGIIKKGVPCVSSSDKRRVENVIKKQCEKNNAQYFKRKTVNTMLGLKGKHQKRNLGTCLKVIELLCQKGYDITQEKIYEAIENMNVPGRFEIVKRKPIIIFDGAHNRESAKCLVQTLKEEFPDKKKVFILGVLKNKDIKGICLELKKIATDFVLVRANNLRAEEPEVIAQYLKGKNINIAKSEERAYNEAKRLAKKDGVIVVTGSFYVIGQLRKLV
jgi:dihydrofolate synthase/folylpolyglutamate synthase